MAYTKKKSTEIKVEIIPKDDEITDVEIAELEATIAENMRETVERAVRDIPSLATVKQVKISIIAEDN